MSNITGGESGRSRVGGFFPLTERFIEELTNREWPFSVGTPSSRSFLIDVAETDTHYIVTADVPGVSNDGIDITVEDNLLSISAQERKVNGDEKANYLHRERYLGFTSRAVSLPRAANADKIEASMKDGILTIRIEKLPEKQTRKVRVVSSGE